MCIIEQKTYVTTDGRSHTYGTTKLCPRAVGDRLCSNVSYRTSDPILVADAGPSTNDDTAGGRVILEDKDGRRTTYRPLSKRSSNSSGPRSTNMSSPASYASSASSPPWVDVKEEMGECFSSPVIERRRAPYPPRSPTPPPPPSPPQAPTSPSIFQSIPAPPDPNHRVTKGGLDIYANPPDPSSISSALDNERHRSQKLERTVLASAMKVKGDSGDEPGSSRRRRKPSISIDTSARPPTLETLPPPIDQRPSVRRDPDRHMSRRESKRPDRQPTDRRDARREDRPVSGILREPALRSPGERTREPARRVSIREPADQPARDPPPLPREHVGRPHRRSSMKEEYPRDNSRERNRQNAFDTLSGQRDPIEENIAAEQAQMAQEKQASRARRESFTSQRPGIDRLSREADARRNSYRVEERSPRDTREQRGSYENRDPPLSPSSILPPSPSRRFSVNTRRPIIHNPPPSSERRDSTMYEYGQDVQNRQWDRDEQARAASRSLNDAIDDMSLEDSEVDDYPDTGYSGQGRSYFYPSQGSRRRKHR